MAVSFSDLIVDTEYAQRSYDGLAVSYTESNLRIRPSITAFRDRLRVSAGAAWQISDISTWIASGSMESYAIRIRRIVAGVPQGFECVLFIGGFGASISYSGNARWLVNGDIRSYIITSADSLYTPNWTQAVWFHNSADTQTFAGGWNSDGELTAGDYTNVVTSGGISPSVNISGFFNSCLEYDGALIPSYSGNGPTLLVELDAEENIAMFWSVSSSELRANTLFICGDVFQIDPVNVGDIYTEGLVWWQRNATTNLISSEEVHAKNAAGTITKDYALHSNIAGKYRFNEGLGLIPSQGSAPREIDGEFSSRKIPLNSPGYDKGWMKPGIALEMGSGNVNIHRQQLLKMFDGPAAGKKYVKWTRYISVLFPENIQFPFVGYPLDRP
jgi:hypothetical protein